MSALPSNNIYSLQNIDSNHIGVVTEKGLNVVEIDKMVSYNLMIPKGPIIYEEKANHLRRIHTGNNGDIIIVSRSGFYHFTKERKLIFRYDDYTTAQAAGGLSFGEYSHWLNEETLILSGKKGIYSYNIHSREFSKVNKGDASFLIFSLSFLFNADAKYHVFQCRKGQFIVLNYKSDSLIYIDEKSKILTYSTIGLKKINSSFSWRSKLFAINDSSLLFTGKFSGLYTLRLNQHTGQIQLDTSAYFADKKCNYFFIDKRNKYWLGFDDGLQGEKSNLINLQLHPDASIHEPMNSRKPLLQVAATNNYLYGASPVSDGIYQFNKATLAFEKTIPFTFPPYGNKSMFAVASWLSGMVVCGSDAGLFVYNEKTTTSRYVGMPGWNPQNNFVADLFTDSKQNIWITTNLPGGVYVWKPGAKMPEWFQLDTSIKRMSEVYHVTEDKEGNLWFAGRGMVRYNKTLKKNDLYIDRFTAGAGEPVAIDALVADEDGGIWAINGDAGVALYYPHLKKAELFKQKNGLPDDKVIGLTYHHGYVWITTKNGIVKINCQTKKITGVCNLKDVFYKQYNSGKLVYDSSSASFFTGVGNAVIRFEEENKQIKNNGPDLVMVYARVGEDSTIWFPSSTIKLQWQNKNLTLFYNAINFEDADFQKYAYRIIRNGKEYSWINQDDQRRIILTDLQAGTTTIEIKVYSPQNAWPEKTLQMEVNVIAPFWRTTWFLLLCFLFIAAILYGIVKYKYNQAQKIIKIKDDISKDLHDEIGATLSGIAMYSHLIKTNLANKQLDAASQSADIIQDSATDMVTKLNDIIWLINPEKESFEDIIIILREYAQKICTAKNITADIEVLGVASAYKPAIETKKNIYLFCKEAINNVAKYSQATSLLIQFSLQDKLLGILIRDDGKGFDPEVVKKGNGLNNMQKRAADMGADFILQSSHGQGCTISLTLKITQWGIA
ncbi:MAG: hypothetical protein IPP48_06775 [Chitinophagaceae bacterium]|nr:hypothetical protein [Chitinophagaceae bacterium]